MNILFIVFSVCSFVFIFDAAFVKEAQAIIGRPLTPVSYAGVARRTTRRMIARETAVVSTTAAATAAHTAPQTTTMTTVPIGTVVYAKPAGCASVVVNGVNYLDCAGVFYQVAFQGNTLVYVVVANPLN